VPRADVVIDVTSRPGLYPVSKGYASGRDAAAGCAAD